jgi:NAD(P)-dependent dehydrogenase (short-subunit alcohol dehydrogenase family)
VKRLDGKVAFITGGGSGIARAASVLFAREGAKVAVAEIDARTEAERRRVETELRDRESRLRTIVWAADLDVWSWDLRANRLTISPSGISRGEQPGGPRIRCPLVHGVRAP